MIKLVHERIDTQFELTNIGTNILVVENPKFFVQLINELQNLIDIDESEFVLSKDNEIIKASKNMYFCTSMFPINLEEKKINIILQKNLEKYIQKNIYEFYNILNQGHNLIIEFKKQYNVKIDLRDEIDCKSLAKYYNPTIEIEGENLLEKLVGLVDVIVEFMDIKLLCILELQNYLTEKEYNLFCKHCAYRDVSLFLLQSSYRYKNKEDKVVIIDKDLCEILV